MLVELIGYLGFWVWIFNEQEGGRRVGSRDDSYKGHSLHAGFVFRVANLESISFHFDGSQVIL